MLVLLNEYNYITSYCDEGYESENYIEIEVGKLKGEELCFNYQYLNGELIKNVPPKKPLGVKLIYNGTEWVEKSKLEEQKKYWLNKMLETNRMLSEYKALGLEGGIEFLALEKELEQYKTKYIDVQHAEALEIDKLKK